MKKVLAILFVAALMGVTFTSCKKDCTCTTKVIGFDEAEASYNYGKLSKKDCQALEDEANTVIGTTTTCTR